MTISASKIANRKNAENPSRAAQVFGTPSQIRAELARKGRGHVSTAKAGDRVRVVGESGIVEYGTVTAVIGVRGEIPQIDIRFDDDTCCWLSPRQVEVVR